MSTTKEKNGRVFQASSLSKFWLVQLFTIYMKFAGQKEFQFLYCSKWMIQHSTLKQTKIKVLVCNLFVQYGD